MEESREAAGQPAAEIHGAISEDAVCGCPGRGSGDPSVAGEGAEPRECFVKGAGLCAALGVIIAPGTVRLRLNCAAASARTDLISQVRCSRAGRNTVPQGAGTYWPEPLENPKNPLESGDSSGFLRKRGQINRR